MPRAPLAILVCGDRSAARWLQFGEQDCAAATENLLLAAVQLGSGAVWLGVHPLEERVDGMRACSASSGRSSPVRPPFAPRGARVLPLATRDAAGAALRPGAGATGSAPRVLE